MASPLSEQDVISELRRMTPRPRPEFAAALDRDFTADPAANGRRPGRLDQLRNRLTWRRLAPAAAGLAVASIAVATAVVSLSTEGGGSNDLTKMDEPAVETRPKPVKIDQFFAPFESQGDERSSPPATAGSSAGRVPQYSESAPIPAEAQAISGSSRRFVERSAQIVLGVEADDLRPTANEIFPTVAAHDGLVLRSSIRDGDPDRAVANFTLSVPNNQLSQLLAAFSELADVRARSDSGIDITAGIRDLERMLARLRAKISRLEAKIDAAEDGAESESLERRLRHARRMAQSARKGLGDFRSRAERSTVGLRIETNPKAGNDRWGIADGIDAAGRILAVAAGVTVIGLAILGPIALLALLIIAGRRFWLRRSRARALDG